MCKSYYEAHKLRQEMENSNAWLNGAYFLRALQATVGNIFAGKDAEPIEYPSEPIGLQRSEEVEAERQRQKDEEEAAFAEAWMANFVIAGKNWGKNQNNTPEA